MEPSGKDPNCPGRWYACGRRRVQLTRARIGPQELWLTCFLMTRTVILMQCLLVLLFPLVLFRPKKIPFRFFL